MSDQLENKIPQHSAANLEDDVIHLLDPLIILLRHKKLVIGMPIVTGILAFAASLLMTPIFSSTARIMPPQQQQTSGVAAMLGQIGGLAGGAGIKSSNDLYVGLLESRTIADNLIKRFNLTSRYRTKTIDDAREALANNRSISSDKKGGFILISASDQDPQFAADLANAFVDELARLNQTMALTEAAQRRLFFEKQLTEARNQLANAEVALQNTQKKTGMIQPDSQLAAIITNAVQLKGTIAAKEVQLNAMRSFAAGKNPELLHIQGELRGLQEQLAKLEKNQPSAAGEFMVPIGKIPEAGVEYVRSARNVKYYETIFDLLAKQFELAKIDEAKDSSLIQLLDKAIPAEHKSKPKRAMIALVGFIVGGVLGIFLAFMHAAYKGSRQNPENRSRWEQVSIAWNGTGTSRTEQP